MNADESCSFCRIVSGLEQAHVVYEDANTVAFLDREPAARGHTLVIPRTHSRTLLDIEPTDAAALMISVTHVARLLDRALHPDGLTALQTNERAGWQSAFHVHVHLIPRWTDDGLILPRATKREEAKILSEVRTTILEAT